MIKNFNGNIFDSKANFIVHQVNCQGVMGSGVASQVAERFPHVEKEYLKYLRHCNKNKINPLGTVQYVPIDTWAVYLTDTMKNNHVEAYDNTYQYIVNLFGQDDYGIGEQHTDIDAVKKAFVDIYNKALSINATIAVPFKIGSYRGGANWEDIKKIIDDIFGKSNVDIEIWKYDLK